MARGESVPSGEALEIYKLCVEMADRVSGRRATANSFFLTLQTALAVLLGVFAVQPVGAEDARQDKVVLTCAAVAGAVLALAWRRLLTSYRRLNRAKFEVINEIERTCLPVRPFTREWEILKRDEGETGEKSKWRHRQRERFYRYADLGTVEQAVPTAFLALYLFLAVYLGWLR